MPYFERCGCQPACLQIIFSALFVKVYSFLKAVPVRDYPAHYVCLTGKYMNSRHGYLPLLMTMGNIAPEIKMQRNVVCDR